MSTYGNGLYGDGAYDGGSDASTFERSMAIESEASVVVGFDIVGQGGDVVLLLTPESATTETLTGEDDDSLTADPDTGRTLILVPEE